MLLGLNLLMTNAGGNAARSGAGSILALEPSLYLDFITGASSSLGQYQDATLDLNFIEPQYDIAATADPAYGYGRYLVQG